jgi:hypothetical protein
MLTVHERDVIHAGRLYRMHVITFDVRQTLTDNDDAVILAEMAAPACHGQLQLTSLGTQRTIWDKYQIHALSNKRRE